MSNLWNIVSILGAITLGLSLLIASIVLITLIAMTIGAAYHRRKNETKEDCVNVVRCKNCQYSNSTEDPFRNTTVCFCDVHQHQVSPGYFCASGPTTCT